MTLDQFPRELVALIDVVIAVAGVVLTAALSLLIVAAERRIREPRPATYAIAVPSSAPPVPELLFTHLHSLLRAAGPLSPVPRITVAAVGSSVGLRLLVSLREEHARA